MLARGKEHTWICLGLTTLTFLVLGRVVGHDFLRLDDQPFVSDNPHVMGGLTGENIFWAFTNLQIGYWQPVTWLSWQLDASLFGPHPWGFHLTNLLLHVANVLLLYWVLWRMTGRRKRSAMVASLFAIHPMHVESVAWVIERKDTLSTFWLLLTLLAYLRYGEKPGWGRYGLVLGCYFLGLASKPMLVTLPVLLLLLDYWPLRSGEWRVGSVESGEWGVGSGEREGEESANRFSTSSTPLPTPFSLRRRIFLEKIPFFLLAGLFVGLTLLGHVVINSLPAGSNVPWGIRLANAIYALAWYLGKTFWPWNLGAWYPHPLYSLTAMPVLLCGAAMIVVLGLLVWLGRGRPAQVVGWSWFFIALLPVLGLIQASDNSRADRFVYVPHIGLFLALVWGMRDLESSLLRRLPQVGRVSRYPFGSPLNGIAVITLGVLSVSSFLQAGYWKDEFTLWQHTLAVTEPKNYRAQGHLAIYYYLQEDYARAEQHLDQSFLHPFNRLPDLFRIKGELLNRHKRWFEATLYLQTGLESKPDDPAIRTALGTAWFHLGEYEKTTTHLRRGLMLQEGTAENYHDLGVAYLKMGQVVEGKETLEKALKLNPAYAPAHLELALAFLAENDLEQARTHLERVVELEPKNSQAEQILRKLRN